MKRQRENIIYLFSVEQNNHTKKSNAYNVEWIKEYMHDNDIPFKTLIGGYKGQLETSFLIIEKYFTKDLKDLIFSYFNQESVLKVDQFNKASLVFKYEKYPSITRIKHIGTLTEVTPVEAQKHESFSILGNRGYIVK